MLLWVRIVFTSILLIAEAQLGYSQDIIYNRASPAKDNVTSSQYLPQNSQQISLPPMQFPVEGEMLITEDKGEISPDLNLFDLTATLGEVEADDQTKAVSVDSSDISVSNNEYINKDNLSTAERQTTNNKKSQNDIIFNQENSFFGDNSTNIDKLISELFPTEQIELENENNLQSDSALQQAVTEKALQEQIQQNGNFDSPNVSVGLRELSGVGLVTTGIGDWQKQKMPFSTLLWSGSKPENIQYLLNISEPYGSSKTINSLVYSSVVRKSAPPIGAAGNPELSQSLVVSRMEWLARAGRSEALADFIRKLPEDDKRWDEWQRWLGAYDLLSYNDSVACDKADRKVSQKFDIFWLKVQILCKVIDGDYEDAVFLAELMSTSGEEDPLFFTLLENVQPHQSNNLNSAQSSLTPLHLILMDLAQSPIEWHQISELPASMMHASNLIKNTTREARLAFAMKQILQQSDAAYEASALIRSLYDTERPLETAYSILQNTKGNLRLIASAEIYSALAGTMFQSEIQGDYDLLFLAAFKEEVKFGNGKALLPFYAELAKIRLTTDSLPSLSLELRPQFEKIVFLHELKNTTSQDMFRLLEEMNTLLFVINENEVKKSPLEVLQQLGLWHLIPVFAEASVIEIPSSWLELAAIKVDKPLAYENLELEPILKKALVEASESQRTAETILIISALIENHDLNQISGSDLALLINSLQQIGFDDTANELIREIIISNLLDLHWGQGT